MTEKKQGVIAPKISREVAEEEFDNFAEAWDIENDTASMTEEDLASYNKQKRAVVNAMMKGYVTIDDEANLIHKLRSPIGDITELKYSIPTGEVYTAISKAKKNSNLIFVTLSKMTGKHSSVFDKMNGLDAKFAVGVATLFLAS